MLKGHNKSASLKLSPKIKNGDNAKLLGRTFQSEAIVPVAALTISKKSFIPRFYVYGGYQILNGMMSDFYSIELDDKQ